MKGALGVISRGFFYYILLGLYERRIQMPNWCEGTLKVRGTAGNIIRFIENGLNVYSGHIDVKTNEYITDVVPKEKWLSKNVWTDFYDDYAYEFKQDCYVEETKRAFIKADSMIDVFCQDNRVNTIIFDFQQAWA